MTNVKPKVNKGGSQQVDIAGHTFDTLCLSYVGPVRFNSDGFYFMIGYLGELIKIDGEDFNASAARAWLLTRLGWEPEVMP